MGIRFLRYEIHLAALPRGNMLLIDVRSHQYNFYRPENKALKSPRQTCKRLHAGSIYTTVKALLNCVPGNCTANDLYFVQ